MIDSELGRSKAPLRGATPSQIRTDEVSTHPQGPGHMQSKQPSKAGVETDQQPPQEVVDRLAELLPADAPDEAVQGLRPKS